MNIPKDIRYTNDHEWVRVEGGEGVIGITDYAQSELGDIVFIDMPDVGANFSAGDPFGTIEAVKAAADLNIPISGEITAVNGLLDQNPELINQEPYGSGWIIKIKMDNSEDFNTLMSADEYAALIAESEKE